MKAYVLTTGIIFGLITVAHVWRAIVEHMDLTKEPWYVLLILVTAALSFWAWKTYRRSPR